MHKTTVLIAMFAISSSARAGQEDTIKALADKLKQGDGPSGVALVKYGVKAVPALINVLEEGSPFARGHAAHALGRIGPKAEKAIPELAKTLMRDGKLMGTESVPASEAAIALGKIGQASVPALIDALKSDNEHVRGLAAGALKEIGPAKNAVPALITALKKSKGAATVDRLLIIDALGRMGPAAKEAVPVLLDARTKEGKPSGVDISVAVALGNIGPHAKEGVAWLSDLMKKKDTEVGPLRMHALEALGKMGTGAKSALPGILAMLRETSGSSRLMVLEVLAGIGSADKESAGALAEGMRDKDALVRIYSAALMGKLEPNNLAVVSVLIESLREKDPKIRILAAQTMGQVRPSDDAVVDALNAVANDSDEGVRKAVKEALAKFKKK